MLSHLVRPVAAVLGLAIAGSAAAQTPDAAKWAELQQKAKAEGQLVVAGPPFQGLRTALAAAFKERFGIELNYLGLFSGEVIARVDTESKAGKVTIDANIGGTSTCWAMAARGQIENMNGKIIAPDAVDPKVWRSGAVKLNPSAATTGAGASRASRLCALLADVEGEHLPGRECEIACDLRSGPAGGA